MTVSSQSGQSSRLFLSSSPTRCSQDPFGEVQVHLQQAQCVGELDTALESVIAISCDAFFEIFSRQVALIRSRSQTFDDHQITIFDKVLLELTQNGSDLENPAAIQYFCDQFLGIPVGDPASQRISALTNTIFTLNAMVPEVEAAPAHPEAPLNGSTTHSRSPEKKSLFGRRLEDVDTGTLAALAADVDPIMSRLWSVYKQAKDEFHAVTDSDSKVKQNAAKFLRDTAENTLQYLQDKAADKRLLQEIETTLEVAKHTAITLHGGKKRKFDQPDSVTLVKSKKPKAFHPVPVSTSRKDMKLDRISRHRESTSSRHFAGHTRAVAHYRTSEPSRGDCQDRRTTKVRELFPTRADTRIENRRELPRSQPGRGHSNIPFGYSRAVDSYHPEV